MTRHSSNSRPPPQMRRKANGAWFVRIYGRDCYLSTDHGTAVAKYAELIATIWQPGQERRAAAAAELAACRAASDKVKPSVAAARPISATCWSSSYWTFPFAD